MFEKESVDDFGIILTHDNIDDVYNKMQLTRQAYLNAFPDDIEELYKIMKQPSNL